MTKQEIHTNVSYFKSILRICGYILLPHNLEGAVIVLVVSEALGIAEEVWGA